MLPFPITNDGCMFLPFLFSDRDSWGFSGLRFPEKKKAIIDLNVFFFSISGFFRCTQIRELASMLSPKFYCLRRRKLNSRVKKPVISDWFSVLVIETSQHCALQQFPVFILTGLRTENLTLFYNVHLLKQRIKTVSAILLTFLSRKKLVIRPISLII